MTRCSSSVGSIGWQSLPRPTTHVVRSSNVNSWPWDGPVVTVSIIRARTTEAPVELQIVLVLNRRMTANLRSERALIPQAILR